MNPHRSARRARWANSSSGWFSPPRLVPIAAAACLLIAVGVFQRDAGPLGWSIEISGPVYRSGDAPAPRAFTDAELMALGLEIQKKVSTGFQLVEHTGDVSWQLSVHIQELPGALLRIEVEGREVATDGEAQRWEKEFDDRAALPGEISVFAEGILADLADAPAR